jgi:hypothetical protein
MRIAEPGKPASLLRSRDLEERSQMPVSERIPDVLGDILYDADDLLTLLRTEAAAARFGWLSGGVQEIYDSVKTMIERISN